MPPKTTTGPLATEPEDHEVAADVEPTPPPAAQADEQAMPPGAEPQSEVVEAEIVDETQTVDVTEQVKEAIGSDSSASNEDAEPEQPKRTRKRENVGQYVVLYAEIDEPNEFRVVLNEDLTPAMYGGKQEDAKRAAVTEDETLREKAKTDGVLIVAVPAGSWRPTQAKAEVKVTFS